MDMESEYGPDLVTVVDEDGALHEFEVVDAIETEDGRYVALLPYYEDPGESVDEDAELVILRVVEENGEEVLEPIEDDDEFDDIAGIFEERLEDMYEIDILNPEPPVIQ